MLYNMSRVVYNKIFIIDDSAHVYNYVHYTIPCTIQWTSGLINDRPEKKNNDYIFIEPVSMKLIN